ncbi:MAG: hypothetical protein QM535_00005, partial [Limnohabitans sp.]|nr:hypothetical protein [Limnohabitans sp.]
FVFTLYRINIEDYYEAGNLIGVNSPLKFDWFGYIFLSITKLIFTTITGFASAFIVIYTYGNTQKGWIENAIYSFLLFLLSILGAYDLATFSDLFMMCTNQMPSSFLSMCWSLIIALILTPLVYFLTKKLIKKIQKSTKYSEVLELVEDFTLFSEIPDKNIDSEDLRRPN